MSIEKVKFQELETLCSEPGFLHVYSYLCRKEHVTEFQGHLTRKSVDYMYSTDKLIRTETSTVHGLMLKNGYDGTLIAPSRIHSLYEKTKRLLSELHDSLKESGYKQFSRKNLELSMQAFFSNSEMIREYIFYSAEQAFDFQFLELAKERYKKDSDWLINNMGFDTNDAYKIYKSINIEINQSLEKSLNSGSKSLTPPIKSYLELYEISPNIISLKSGQPAERIIKFLENFSTESRAENASFNNISDFNIINAKPIIKKEKKYYLFNIASLAQALYESPIFWMREDKKYRNHAEKHRGQFTEEFAFEKLEEVFGKNNVLTNIDIFKSSSEKIGEIDVLVVFGNKALVIQAKSKGLTIPSRKGQVEIIKDDFIKGFQNAYDQALECAAALTSGANITLKNSNGEKVEIKDKLITCYPICLTSESYPALSFQCKIYLDIKKKRNLAPPLVMDIFFLDILTEFLETPLYLLSYIDIRCNLSNRIMGSTEIVLLSMHLKNNLWQYKDNFDFINLHDDIASDLDVALMVRRLGLPGQRTPDGILTRNKEGFTSKLIKNITQNKSGKLINLGLSLLKSSNENLDQLDNSVIKIRKLAAKDKSLHDFSYQMYQEDVGLTIHTLAGNEEYRRNKLRNHVEMRKYVTRSRSWAGVIIDPLTGTIIELCIIDSEWKQSDAMDNALKKTEKFNNNTLTQTSNRKNYKKDLGRNEKCRCGSGKKYKKCCLK